ncbi:MAG: DUF2085 domain-containing protein [Lachnospiraceae bacterium]|nr:DUF2085 domain-containing protein [Lachnospiraceae bacterium]MCI9184670.1 DUF2085 domain-containing protein [Lachnospiraceae bacterium]
MGKFLRIFFGCHGRADRSFFFRGRQFPICARCTGELIGILCGIPIVLFIGYASFPMTLLLMAPLVADGFLQLLTPYESKNYRRLITGILFGVAFVFFLIYYYRANIIVAGTIVKWFIDPAKVDKAMEQFLWQTGQICLTTLCI